MTDRADLLAAVCASPDDDAPRLVYADWCEENGDSRRAEFIRVQCELAREEAQSPRWRKLAARERKLWDPAWRDSLKGKVLHSEFGRGFAERITIYAKRFVEDGEAIFATEPVRAVKFASFRSRHGTVPVERLADSPLLERVRELDLEGSGLTGPELARLGYGGHLRHLAALSVRGQRQLVAADLIHVLAGDALPALHTLDLNDTGFNGPDVVALLGSRKDRPFRALNLSQLNLGAWAVATLLVLPSMSALEALDLGAPGDRQQTQGDAVARAIAEARHLIRLRELKLGMQRIGDEGAMALAGAPHLAGLRRLSLHLNQIGDRGVEALVTSPHLGGLYWLDLDLNVATRKEALKKLARERFPDAVVRLS